MGLLGKVCPSVANVPTLVYKVPASKFASLNINLYSRTDANNVRLCIVDKEDLSIESISVTTPGKGCVQFPTLTVNGANTTKATVNVNTMTLAELTIKDTGNNYAVNDLLTATIATATATTKAGIKVTAVDASGSIVAIQIADGGIYTALTPETTNHEISVTGGSGTGASFHYGKFGIKTVTITNSGNGYSQVPTISVSEGSLATFNITMNIQVEGIDDIDGASMPLYGVIERTGIVLSEGQAVYVVTDKANSLNVHVWGFEKLA